MRGVFECRDYQEILRTQTEKRKGVQPGYTYGQLSKAMQVQAPYLSRVLRHEADLNTDQLFSACEHFNLSETETEYSLLLLEVARSTLNARKRKLQQRINEIREEHQHTKNHIAAEFLSLEESVRYHEYYLEPMALVVHMCLMIPAYQPAESDLGRVLSIPLKRLQDILGLLERLKIIQLDRKKNRWVVLKEHIQLDQKSSVIRAHQELLRHASIEVLQRLPQKEKYQFSVTFSADEETRTKVRTAFNEFLKKTESLVRSAPSELVCQLNFDFFRWDGNSF